MRISADGKTLKYIEAHDIGPDGSLLVPIPNSVTIIEDHAFADCKNLTGITLPESITSLGKCAFYGCINLTIISIPEGVTSIGNRAFSRCKNLISINIPDSVTHIGSWAFDKCTNLEHIFVENDAEVERIKALLPTELQDKVISRAPYIKIEKQLKHEYLTQLAKQLNICRIRTLLHILGVPDDVVGIMNQFLGDDSHYYREAKKEMDEVPLLFSEGKVEQYKSTLEGIINKYKKLADTNAAQRQNNNANTVNHEVSEHTPIISGAGRRGIDDESMVDSQSPSIANELSQQGLFKKVVQPKVNENSQNNHCLIL